MKALFRFHRGSLADSMSTLIQVDYLDDVENAEENDFIKTKNLECMLYYNKLDDRIGWDKTYIITGDHYFDDALNQGERGVVGFSVVGFSNEMLNYRDK